MPTIRFGGLTVLICAVLAWIFLTAGLATPMYKSKNGATTKITPFKYKVNFAFSGSSTIDLLDAPGLCTKQKDRFRAIQAFGIMSNLASVAVAVVAGVATFLPEGLVRLPVSAGLAVFAAAALAVITSVLNLIAWAIVAGTYNEKICGTKIKNSFEYGPTIGLWIVAWMLLLVGGIVGAVLGIRLDKIQPTLRPVATTTTTTTTTTRTTTSTAGVASNEPTASSKAAPASGPYRQSAAPAPAAAQSNKQALNKNSQKNKEPEEY